MDLDLDAVHALALSLARGAGELARRGAAEGRSADEVRRDLERRTMHGITGRFRDHAVVAPGSGRHGPDGALVTWLVDPLDGSDNHSVGLDLYGVRLAVLLEDVPVVGVVHDAATGRSTSAVMGRGATSEGVRLAVAEDRPLAECTVSWLEEPVVDVDDTARRDTVAALEHACRRVVRTGAACIDWALLARGGTNAVVALGLARNDLAAGVLVAQEAGAAVHTIGDLVVAGAPEVAGALAARLGSGGPARSTCKASERLPR